MNKMNITIAFDVYGTLIDTHGITSALERYAGNRAPEFSRMWREKQLEYSFRRGLMQNYASFDICTSNALDFTSTSLKIPIDQSDKDALMGQYKVLPAFADVKNGLAKAKDSGFRLFAFSNGRADAVEVLLNHAGIREYFIDVVSVDEMKSYKPNPGVYSHFLRRSGATCSDAWLVSGNPFDVIGAISAGMRAAWVKRSPDSFFDPWGIEPTLTVNNLANLAEQIARVCNEA
jgi:2-haloacid dehalogenase